jgi:hypothetical protein
MPLQIRETYCGECPKCRFSLEPLRDSPVLTAEEGYLLDSRAHSDADDNIITSLLFGCWERYVYRYFIAPISSRTVGNWKKRRYRKILQTHPHSLICTHCRFVVKR